MRVLAQLNSRLKVGTRVSAGFGTLLALLIGIGAVGYFALSGAQESFGKYDRVTNNAVRVLEINRDFVGLRRNIGNFVDDGSEQTLARARELQKTIREQLDVVVKALIIPEVRQMMVNASAAFAQYGTNFDAIVQKRAERGRLVNDTMFPLGAKLSAGLTEIMEQSMAEGDMALAARAGVAQEALGHIRLAANRYLFLGDPQYRTAAEKSATALAASLDLTLKAALSPARQAQVKRIADQVPEFARAFQAAAAAIVEVKRLDDDVGDKLAGQITQGLASVKDLQVKTLQKLGATSAAEMEQAITTSLSVMGGAIVLGVLLAWGIGRGISGPVRGMTTAMTGLAGGNLEIEVPAQANQDEIGDMAKAVQVFKENALEVRQMHAEQEGMKQRAEAEKKAAMNKMADRLEASVRGVVGVVSSASDELQSAATAMTATAEETQRQAAAVTAASDQATDSVATVASAAEELSASVDEINRQVTQSASISDRAVEEAERTNQTIKGLAEAP